MDEKRTNNRLPVAREGLPFIFIGLIVTVFFAFLGLYSLVVIFGILFLFTIYFFRDPERGPGDAENAVFTPADGKIIDIRYIDNSDNLLGEPTVKLSVFMSIFSVHVNRIPFSGKIKKISYHTGKFLSANLDKASNENEKNSVTLETGDGRKIVFVQIAGLIARRIVCWIKEGDKVAAGQRFGLIRFGSRLDIYLPGNSRIIAKPKSHVRAGETILGYLS